VSGAHGSAAAPAPFATAGSASQPDLSLSLDGTRIPPVIALSPMSGLDFGTGISVGPLLALLDALGIAGVCHLVRRHWLNPAD